MRVRNQFISFLIGLAGIFAHASEPTELQPASLTNLDTTQITTVPDASKKSKVPVTTDLTWTSQYMINGFNVGGDSPAYQLTAKADMFNTGLSLMFWSSIQQNRENKQYDELDLFLLYGRDFLKESRYEFNLHGFYDYWMFPNSGTYVDQFGDTVETKKKHGNKLQAGITMPKLIPFAESYLVPTYNAHFIHYYAEDREDLYLGGFHHEMLLEYFRELMLFIPGATYQYGGVKGGLNYYDGAFGVDSGFSHTTASLVSGVYALKSIFEVSLNYQWSYKEAVNPDNEFWSTLSFIKKF